MLNGGANARLLSRFTGKDVHVEASDRTRSYDLWSALSENAAGHILRLEGPRIVKLAVKVQHENGLKGGLLLDVQRTLSFEVLTTMASCRKT